jgi:hypothetical protein
LPLLTLGCSKLDHNLQNLLLSTGSSVYKRIAA